MMGTFEAQRVEHTVQMIHLRLPRSISGKEKDRFGEGGGRGRGMTASASEYSRGCW